MPKLRDRKAYLVPAYNDSTGSDKNIIINITLNAPSHILNITDNFIAYRAASTDSVTVTAPVTPTVAIVDPDDVTRYNLIARAKAPVSGNEVDIIYDKKYMDIFIIPTVKYHSLTFTNTSYIIHGTKVGGGSSDTSNGEPTYNGSLMMNPEKLPECNIGLTTITHIATLNGLHPNSEAYMLRPLTSGYVANNIRMSPICLIELGTSNEVFVTPTSRVKAYTIYQSSVSSFKYQYLGKIPLTDKIVIPLIF